MIAESQSQSFTAWYRAPGCFIPHLRWQDFERSLIKSPKPPPRCLRCVVASRFRIHYTPQRELEEMKLSAATCFKGYVPSGRSHLKCSRNVLTVGSIQYLAPGTPSQKITSIALELEAKSSQTVATFAELLLFRCNGLNCAHENICDDGYANEGPKKSQKV